jgi:F-type H+-transporting ATPase subunit b
MHRVKTLLAIAGVSAVVLAAAGPAWAEGLPQLDTKNFAPQLIWLAISFVILYLLMARVALPRVVEVLEDRQRRIDENLKKAEVLKADAEAVAEAYQKAIAEARATAQAAVREVRETAAAEAARRQAELGEKLTQRIKAAEERIAEARDRAVGDLKAMAMEVAGAAVEKLLGERPDAASLQAAVEKAGKERA